jgi:hypothetical protein
VVGAPNVDRRFGWAGMAIVALGLFLRLYYVSIAEVDQPLRADAAQYFQIALNVRNFSTFSTSVPTAEGVPADSYRAPGYPALIALLGSIFGSNENTYWSILVLQCLLGAATVALTLLLALRIMPVPWAYAAAVLTAIWPHLITLGGYVLTETVFGFLVILSAYTLVLMLERRGWLAPVVAGVAFAAAALVNQIILGLSIPLAIWLCLARRSWRIALFTLLALGPPALWSVRDAHIETTSRMSSAGRLIENVLTGMEPDFIPHYKDDAREPAAVAARRRIADGQQVYVKDRSAALAGVWQRLKSEPGRLFWWYLEKPVYFWTWSVFQGYGDVYVYPMLFAPFDRNPVLRAIASLCHGLNTVIMMAAFAGAFVWLRRKRETGQFRVTAAIVALVFLYATVIHTILNPDARYAVPFRPFEFVLAMLAASALAERMLQARHNRSTPETAAKG